MNIELKHVFKRQCYNLSELLTGCNKLSTFCSRLEKQSVLFPDRIDPDKYKGNGFEFFTEALLKLNPIDNRIGIGDYKLVTQNDTGVDGYGVGINGNPATVQVKYRNDNTKLLVERDLHQFPFVSLARYGVKVEDINNMLVITTADDLHYYTKDQMFLKKVRCLGYNQLRSLVDNNILFWDSFRGLCNLPAEITKFIPENEENVVE